MALQALRNINRERDTSEEAPKVTFPVMLEKFKGEIARALPRHLNPDRMARIALTAFRMTPELAKCDPRSVFAAVIQSSQLGLEVGLMGEAHLVPFNGQCQLIPGYTGLIKLARQSGLVQDIFAHEVRMNDKFMLRLGMERSLEHEPLTALGGFPASDKERGEVVGFYAVAVFKDGVRTFVAMSCHEVEKIRDGSRAYQAAKRYKKISVWDTDFVAMGLKTVIRRLAKFLPKSPELATALAMDTVNEQDQAQNLDINDVIEGNYAPTLDDEPEDAPNAKGATDTKPEAIQRAKSSRPDAPIVQAVRTEGRSTGNGASTLGIAIEAMKKAKTVEALDEAYLRAEAGLDNTDLETLMREYRRLKADLGRLI
jgi:recombination protein RecT